MKLAFDPPPPTPSLLPWHSRFAQLGEKFCAPQYPTALSEPYWVTYSEDTANLLQLPLHDRRSDAWLQAFSGNAPVPHNTAPQTPSASVYSGHQFGVWAGQLGDGRALLLGELQGQEIQLKGAGPTPFSRMGDGRAVLRSSIREFLCSEAMHALGIPTTRALCVTGSDSPVYRETTETAAVLTRTAPSFIRFGHFEHFSHTGQHAELQTLADFVIEHFYPACRNTPPDSESSTAIHNPYAALLAAVTERTAHLIAHWQSVGFCHGVMNTDNMSILGLTIDYGPFQFLDGYDPRHICNHSDHQGRYAFYNQANMAYWNLFCLGQALLPLIEVKDQAIAAIETFKTHYPQALQQRFAAKLGFTNASKVPTTLIEHLLKLLASDRVDYTIFWRTLSHWTRSCDLQNHAVHTLFHDTAAIDAWLQSYRDQLQNLPSQDLARTSQRMLRINPQYVLRNYLGELAIRAAHAKDFSVVAQLLHILQHPFEEHPNATPWAAPPPDWAKNIEISCSS